MRTSHGRFGRIEVAAGFESQPLDACLGDALLGTVARPRYRYADGRNPQGPFRSGDEAHRPSNISSNTTRVTGRHPTSLTGRGIAQEPSSDGQTARVGRSDFDS